jgi:signal transduction histidine kinase/CheY-like chemotaxis protein
MSYKPELDGPGSGPGSGPGDFQAVVFSPAAAAGSTATATAATVTAAGAAAPPTPIISHRQLDSLTDSRDSSLRRAATADSEPRRRQHSSVELLKHSRHDDSMPLDMPLSDSKTVTISKSLRSSYSSATVAPSPSRTPSIASYRSAEAAADTSRTTSPASASLIPSTLNFGPDKAVVCTKPNSLHMRKPLPDPESDSDSGECNQLPRMFGFIYRHRVSMSQVGIIASCVALIAFVLVRNQQAQEEFLTNVLQSFGDKADEAIIGELRFATEFGRNMQTAFLSSPNMTRKQFLINSRSVNSDATQSTVFVQWLPRVPYSQLASFNARMSAEYGRPVNITSCNPLARPQDCTSPPPVRSEYFPAAYLQPETLLPQILMVDALASPSRNATIYGSRSTATIYVSRPVELPYIGPGVIGFASLFPVYTEPYGENTTGATSAQLVSHTAGMISLITRIDRIMSAAAPSLNLASTSITVCDTTTPTVPIIAVSGLVDKLSKFHIDSSKRYSQLSQEEQTSMCIAPTSSYTHLSYTSIGGRQWSIRVDRAPGFADAHASLYTLSELVWVSIVVVMLVATFVALNGFRLRQRAIENEYLLDEAHYANEAKDTFVAFLCHELRNPLHAVISAVDELEEMPATPPDIANALTIGSQTMLSIVNDILDMPSIESGKFNVSHESISLAKVLNTVVASHKAWASASDITLSLDVSEDVPDNIISDQTRITQVLNNLMSNALKNSDENTKIVLSATILHRPSNSPSLETVNGESIDHQIAAAAAAAFATAQKDFVEDGSATTENKHSGNDPDHGHEHAPPTLTVSIDEYESVDNGDDDNDECDSKVAISQRVEGNSSSSAAAAAAAAAAASAAAPIDWLLVLSVVDQGSGMTQEQLSQLFTPYTQFDNRKASHQRRRRQSQSRGGGGGGGGHRGALSSPSVSKKSESDENGNDKHRTKHRKKFAGTGIGMTIVETIVQSLNGFMSVESQIGEGSAFHMYLPLITQIAVPPTSRETCHWHCHHGKNLDIMDTNCSDSSSSQTQQQVNNSLESTAVVTAAHCQATIRVNAGEVLMDDDTNNNVAHQQQPSSSILLIVDDDRMNRKIISRHASRMLSDVKLVEAVDGQKAVDFMKSDARCQVIGICMDLNMPVLSGLEATKQIRELDEHGAHVPIFGVTANAFAEDRERCFKAGMNDVLPKPFRKADFQHVVVDAILQQIATQRQ